MRADKKQERENQKLLEWLKRAGQDTSQVKIEQQPIQKESIQTHSLHAEAASAYWEKGKEFRDVTCRECGAIFATNYGHNVRYCSDPCRKKALEKIGIAWSPFKTQHERWGRIPPLIVPPEALVLLKELREEGQNHVPTEVVSVDLPVSSDQWMDDSQEFQDFSLD